jgi:hypothetical protein
LKIIKDSFNINKAIFDCGSMHTFFKTNYDQNEHNVLRLESEDSSSVKEYLPNFFQDIKDHIKSNQRLTLIFWHREVFDEDELPDEIIRGPSKLFIVNSKKEAALKPGCLLELDKGEEISLSYRDFSYGFVLLMEDLIPL